MKITQKNGSNRKINGLWLPMLVALSIFVEIISARAQVTVQLPQLVIEAKHTEYVETQNPGTPNIIDVKSGNPSVATAVAYRVNRVQIVAVAPGKTTVEFFDNTQRVLYKVPVWVTAPNSTGGGGQGYNPRLAQLPQIVMLVKRTENAHTPDDPAAKISGVRSSNPSVATARTDPPRGIQIYAVALGDTFVEFTDNTTGTTYQVHVWVQKPGDPAPKGGPGSKPDSAHGPTPKTKASASPKSGSIDPCLVGVWRSESLVGNLGFSYKGGADIILTIKPDGLETIDYNGMTPLERDGESHLYRGIVEAYITTSKGTATITKTGKTDLTVKETDRALHTWEKNTKTLGQAALGNYPADRNYTCDETTLKFRNAAFNSIFKRERK